MRRHVPSRKNYLRKVDAAGWRDDNRLGFNNVDIDLIEAGDIFRVPATGLWLLFWACMIVGSTLYAATFILPAIIMVRFFIRPLWVPMIVILTTIFSISFIMDGNIFSAIGLVIGSIFFLILNASLSIYKYRERQEKIYS